MFFYLLYKAIDFKFKSGKIIYEGIILSCKKCMFDLKMGFLYPFEKGHLEFKKSNIWLMDLQYSIVASQSPNLWK